MLQHLLTLAAATAVASALPFHLTNGLSGEAAGGSNWAVLVAGSDGWFNYRHQADVSHAYQILRKNGYPEDKIITFMKDDIAHNERNPTPGIIINKPGGPDVYKGVKIDYRGENVTVENFIKVLLGQATNAGTGATLKTGPRDHVFVNFVDHGGAGIIAFPGAQLMTSKQLIDTLAKMHTNKRYGELVFYMEACEGGSMFENLLPSNWSIFATTAATATQSSYATYFDNLRRTFLGDVYSVAWMEDADAHFAVADPLKTRRTLEEEFLDVAARTKQFSQPQQYGDIDLANRTRLEDFLAYGQYKDVAPNGMPHYTPAPRPVPEDTVSSRDVTVYTLTQMLRANGVDSAAVAAELEAEIRAKQMARDRFDTLAYLVAGPRSKQYEEPVGAIHDHTCLHDAVYAFHGDCHVVDDHHIAHVRVLAHLCNDGFKVDHIKQAIAQNPMCRH